MDLDQVADEIAAVLEVDPEDVGISRSREEIILDLDQARRLVVLARQGLDFETNRPAAL